MNPSAKKPEWERAHDKVMELITALAIAQAKTDKKLDRVARHLGKLGNNLGKEFEEDIVDLLREEREVCGIKIDSVNPNMVSMSQNCEFDIVATNGDYVIVMEAKRTLNKKDIYEFATKTLPLFKVAYPGMAKGKKVIGALVYQRTHQSIKAVTAALEAGIHIIAATPARTLRQIKTPQDLKK